MGVVRESRKIENFGGHCAVIFAIAQLSCLNTGCSLDNVTFMGKFLPVLGGRLDNVLVLESCMRPVGCLFEAPTYRVIMPEHGVHAFQMISLANNRS